MEDEAQNQRSLEEYDVFLSYGPGNEHEAWADQFVDELQYHMENLNLR